MDTNKRYVIQARNDEARVVWLAVDSSSGSFYWSNSLESARMLTSLVSARETLSGLSRADRMTVDIYSAIHLWNEHTAGWADISIQEIVLFAVETQRHEGRIEDYR